MARSVAATIRGERDLMTCLKLRDAEATVRASPKGRRRFEPRLDGEPRSLAFEFQAEG